MQRKHLSFWQLFNMSFGFLGIQFGWGLQLANMSAVYEKLGARPDEVPILWLAAPLTGLLVQPIVGVMSDRTWGRFGRRRPYFFVGAVLASIALFFMPTSSTLWMAAGLLWVLDASVNISMEPFRAFVADKLAVSQRTAGFVMQSFFIGIGASLANALPFALSRMGVTGSTASGIPLTVKYSFQIGAAVFLLAVLWTVFTTDEFPPENLEEFERERRVKRGIGHMFAEIGSAVREMPATMKQLTIVQIRILSVHLCHIAVQYRCIHIIIGLAQSSTCLFIMAYSYRRFPSTAAAHLLFACCTIYAQGLFF